MGELSPAEERERAREERFRRWLEELRAGLLEEDEEGEEDA